MNRKSKWLARVSMALAYGVLPAPHENWVVSTAEAAAVPQETYATLTNSDLDALVAPIALYPDALVAQILGAATYPDQVADADAYVQANSGLSLDQQMQAAEGNGWDPSVVALLQFPSVLDKLAKNIEWTSALGDASANQQGDLLAAIQRMRAKAYASGNLQSGQQIKVVKESPDIIVIQPANPQVVYVPTYNPTVVYGAPVTTPGYSPGDLAAASIISFGVGIAVGAAISGSSCGYSYSSWNMRWHSSAIYCGGARYYGNPYWWGGYYPGYYPGYRPPYYPPPRPPKPPPPGWRPPPGMRPPRPVHPIENPRPPRPGGPSTQPIPPQPGRPSGGRPPTGPGQPGGPSTQPGQPPRPGTRPVPPQPGGGGAGPPGTRPSNPSTRPTPATPTTRPSPKPSPQPSSRELRGYPSSPSAQPAQKPNAFSGTVGGRPQSARGNSSMGASGGGGRR